MSSADGAIHPACRTRVKFVKSVNFMENDGYETNTITEEQIIGFLKQAEAGMPIKELCHQGGFSDATFYKWRAKFGGMQASVAKRLRAFVAGNLEKD